MVSKKKPKTNDVFVGVWFHQDEIAQLDTVKEATTTNGRPSRGGTIRQLIFAAWKTLAKAGKGAGK